MYITIIVLLFCIKKMNYSKLINFVTFLDHHSIVIVQLDHCDGEQNNYLNV